VTEDGKRKGWEEKEMTGGKEGRRGGYKRRGGIEVMEGKGGEGKEKREVGSGRDG